jgi:hypothetical protein
VIVDLPGAGGIDRTLTVKNFHDWIAAWESRIFAEEEFISGQGTISSSPMYPPTRSPLPLMLVFRGGDEAIAAKVRELGIGAVRSPAEIVSQGIADIVPVLPENRERFDSLPAQFTNNGTRSIAGTVMEFLA